MNKPVTIAFFLFCGALYGQSSDPEAPKPSEPLIRSAPQQAIWTVDFTSQKRSLLSDPKEAAKSLDQPITKSEIEKHGAIFREVSTYNGGRKAETWTIGGLVVSDVVDGTPIQMDDPAGGITSFKTTDFDDISWITLADYKGVVDYKGQKAFLFSHVGKRRLTGRETVSVEMWNLALTANKNAPKPVFLDGESQVYLDVVTQMPIAFDDGEFKGVYTISSAPPPAMAIPKDFQVEIKKAVDYMRAYGNDPTNLLKGRGGK